MKAAKLRDVFVEFVDPRRRACRRPWATRKTRPAARPLPHERWGRRGWVMMKSGGGEFDGGVFRNAGGDGRSDRCGCGFDRWGGGRRVGWGGDGDRKCLRWRCGGR